MEASRKTNTTSSAAFIVMLAFTVSRLTGFLREMLLPAKLGVGEISDAYTIAFQLPDLMYTLVIGGAVSAALVPVLSGYLGRNEEEQGWKSISIFINVVFTALLFFCSIGMIFTPQLIRIVAAGYGKSMPENMALAVRLTRILFPSVSVLMLAGITNGILYSYKKFVFAAFGPAIYNVFSAMSFLLFANKDAGDHYGVVKIAYGVLGGTTLYFLLQAFQARKQLIKYRPLFHLKEPGFIRLFKLAIPSLVSSSVLQVNIITGVSIASLFDPGSVTSLRLADRLWQMPLGIIAQGIGFAMLPSLSEKYAVGDTDSYKKTLLGSLKTVLLLSIPCAVGFMILNRPIVRTVYKFSEEFTEADVSFTAHILMFYMTALIMQSATTIINRGFYARNDTKTPLFISTGSIAVNIFMCIALYKLTNLGVAGMAVAYSISSTMNAVILLLMLNKKAQAIPLRSFGIFAVKTLVSAGIMGVVLYFINGFFPFREMGKAAQVVSLIFEVLIGAAVFFISALLLKSAEAQEFTAMISQKVGKLVRKVFRIRTT